MKIPCGYSLINSEIVMENETAEVVRSIFAYYSAGASLGKVVDMLLAKGVKACPEIAADLCLWLDPKTMLAIVHYCHNTIKKAGTVRLNTISVV